MENASKALIIMGGVLIGALIVTLSIFLFQNTAELSASYSGKLDKDEITMFNNKFEVYAKDTNSQGMVSVINIITENNKKNVDEKITLVIDGKKINTESITQEVKTNLMKNEENYKFSSLSYNAAGIINCMNFTSLSGSKQILTNCVHEWDYTNLENKHKKKCKLCTIEETEDHIFEDYRQTKAATCTEEGVLTATCICGQTDSKSIPKTGHTPGTEATCTTPQKCTKCGATLANAKGHKAGAVETCTTPQICTVCKITLKEKLGHTYDNIESNVDKNAITSSGHGILCTRCKGATKTYSHTKGAAATCETDQICTICKYVIVSAKGHIAGPVATCTEPQICTVCKVTLKEKLGHTYSNTASNVDSNTITSSGHGILCTRCKGAAKTYSHTPGAAATCTTPQKCTICGYTITAVLGHTGQTHDNEGKCTRCNTTYVTHSWGTYIETKAATCTTTGVKTATCTAAGCGRTDSISTSALEHYGGTHANKGKCTRCGTIYQKHTVANVSGQNDEMHYVVCICGFGEDEEHTFGAWSSYSDTLHQHTCTVCLRVVKEAHDFGSWSSYSATMHKRTCNTCRKEVQASHNMTSSVIKEATCTEAGNKRHYCTTCTYSYDVSISALTHTYTNSSAYLAGQPVASGHGIVCSRCGGGAKQYPHTAGAAANCTTPQKCTICSYTITAKLGHTGQTHDNGGKCTRCSTVYVTHSWGTYKETKAATCVDEGTKTATCTADGCGKTTTTAISRLGHSFTKKEYSTYNAANHQVKMKCSRCDYASPNQPTLEGHSITTPPTCGKASSACTKCGGIQPATGSHSYGNWGYYSTTMHRRTCNTCRAEDQAVHSYSSSITTAATCTAGGVRTKICSGCGSSYTEPTSALGHDYRNVYGNVYICWRCGTQKK